jgi:hypothetical protein
VNANYLLVLVALCACQSKSASPAPNVSVSAIPTPSRPPSAADALDELDGRREVPLLPMMAHHQKQSMRDHLVVVQEVVAALGASDFVKVAESAKRIGYSETMGRMCQHMGAGAPGFTEQALAFHRTADSIVHAAAERDSAAVLTALSSTLAACTTCHASYKQKLVDTLP